MNSEGFISTPPLKACFNVGCLLDVYTGTYITGVHGESILNGGIMPFTSVVGGPNNFKSTFTHYLTMSAARVVMLPNIPTKITTYDTEMSMFQERLIKLGMNIEGFQGRDVFEDGTWVLTTRAEMMGNEWFEALKKFVNEEKIKKEKTLIRKTPMLLKNGQFLEMMTPSFGQIDSLTEFVSKDIEDMQNKNELGDSGGNTIFMRMGLVRTRLAAEFPVIAHRGAHYTVMTGHVGESSGMTQGPPGMPQPKKMQYMKASEKIKGVGEKFLFLANTLWQLKGASLLTNDSTKGPEFPRTQNNPDPGSTDLNTVNAIFVRSKSGRSGEVVKIVVSQDEGILPHLTEFLFIKDNGRFGLEGSVQNYALSFLPDVKLMRTTIRERLDENPELRRAMTFTSELLQIKKRWPSEELKDLTPEMIYAKLSKKYNWKEILNTRGNWTFNNDDVTPPFLSTMDLINMYFDRYIPFWMK